MRKRKKGISKHDTKNKPTYHPNTEDKFPRQANTWQAQEQNKRNEEKKKEFPNTSKQTNTTPKHGRQISEAG